MKDNIERFNVTAGLILDMLHDVFPTRPKLSHVSLAVMLDDNFGYRDCQHNKAAEMVGLDPSEIHPGSKEANFVRDTLLWLAEFGFIAGSIDYEYSEATLSPAGLAIMGLVVDSNGEIKEKGLGSAFSKMLGGAVRTAASDQVSILIGSAIRALASGAYKAVTST